MTPEPPGLASAGGAPAAHVDLGASTLTTPCGVLGSCATSGLSLPDNGDALVRGPCRSPRGSCWRYKSCSWLRDCPRGAQLHTHVAPTPAAASGGLWSGRGHGTRQSGPNRLRGDGPPWLLRGDSAIRGARKPPLLPSLPSLCPSELPRGLPRPPSPLPSFLERDPAQSSTRGSEWPQDLCT